MCRLLIVGQFPPPVTGEGVVNEFLFHHLKDHLSNDVRRVNSVILDDVGSVGKFSFKKFFKAIFVLLRAVFLVPFVQTVYLVPGQTVFGLCRFLFISVFARILFKRLVVHWHGYGLLHLLVSVPLLSRFFLWLSSVNILLTNDLLEKIMRLGMDPDKFEIVRNYTSIDQITRSPKITGRLRVLYLSSLMHEKGIDEFLDVAACCSGMDFYICGSGGGDLIDKCIVMAAKYSNIFYLGLVDGIEKRNVLVLSDVFVLQTYYPTEGVPLSLLDAMRAGCAVITTAHNGITETVGDSAVFVQPKSVTDLMNALIKLNSNRPDLARFSTMASQQSLDFSQEIFLRRMKIILSSDYSK